MVEPCVSLLFCLGLASYLSVGKSTTKTRMPCSTVSMDIYWNGIATPLFLFVIANGLLALFNMSSVTGSTVAFSVKPTASSDPVDP